MKLYWIIPLVLLCIIPVGAAIQHENTYMPMASLPQYNFTFNQSSFIYIVTIAQLTNEQPGYNATDVNSVAFTISGPSWVSLGTLDQLEINPPPTLHFNATSDNYGTYKLYLNGTAIINGTTTQVFATTTVYITVVEPLTTTISKAVSSASSLFHIPTKLTLVLIGASIITGLVVIALVTAASSKKKKEIEEEKYEKVWLR